MEKVIKDDSLASDGIIITPLNNLPKIIRVTAAIIEKEGKILIAKRKAGDDLFAGLWEFPGGKIEEGETPEECIARELKEELDIEVKVGKLISSNKHKYPHGIFELLAYRIKHISGAMILNDHDEIKWVTVDEMSNFEFPPADIPIITYLGNANI
tara:strand:+ start:122 stop:586 length:465 start_codon:yes stop_codon:yes gene_type:complete